MASCFALKQWPKHLFYLQLFISTFGTGLSIAFRKDLDDSEPKGPKFREEPPARVEFSNSSGAEIRCSVEGSTPIRVFWQTREGTEATDVAGLRYQRGDATLVFPPFERSEYRQDVHDSVYQCVAVNDVGKVLSRETHVRGVIQQKFSPQVYDDFVIRGNTAVLRCHLPAFVREYVTMDAWIRNEDDAVLRETDAADDKYSVLPSGELLLYKAEDKDSRGNYRCRARHRLTGELVTSTTSGKIVVTEPHSPMSPKIIFSQSQVRAEEGSHVRVPCVSQAQPPPSYRWMKDTITGTLPLLEDGRVRVLPGGTLHIRSVRLSDGGKYQCLVKNNMGEKRTDTLLLVTAPLKVKVIPTEQTLNIGEAAVLNCSVSGHPVHTVIWKKDGRPLNSNARVQLMSRDVVHVTSVRREDKGMYQCFAWNDADGAQATAELRIGDVPPYLLSAFPDVAVYPGEFVSLKCVSSGNSVPRVTWTIDGSLVTAYQGTQRRVQLSDVVSAQGHVSSYLNISEARTDDSGEYRCDVTNDVGTAWHAARLNVYGSLFVRPFKNSSAVSGQELMLKCPVGGYPIQSISWQKGGINLPLDHRQKVSPSGILTIQNVQRAADQGEYTCIAKGQDGQRASGSTYVSLVVAPVIDAQLFPETITANEGSRTKIMCSVPIGDPPISLRWLKNNIPFTGSGKITMQRLEDSSIMLFRKIKSSDRGKYTCIVSNSAASSNLTTNLIVNVPPSWISEPTNMSVILSHSVWLNCSADGYPIPNIIWRKARESNPGDFGYVHSSSRIRQYNNGTLVLWDADISDRGFYLCQANNGIGAALSKVIFLNVQVPPKFEESYQSRAVRERENASLKCTAVGNTPIAITWKKNKMPLPIKPNSRFSLKETSEDGRMISELLILSTTRQENGLYGCSATNDFGSDEATFQLIVQGVPDPPVNLTVSNVSSRTISITWEVPYNGNSHITGSSVQYKLASDSWKGHTSQLIVSGSETIAMLRALLPVSTYQVRIITENAIGKSIPSDILNVTTEVEAPSGPPRELSVHPTGDQSLKVTWKPPREETTHGPIQGYYVGYRIHLSLDKYQFKRVDGLKELQHSTYVTGLQPFTSYEIVVKAFNSAGSGPKSDSVVGTTLETAPPTSPLLQVTSTYPDSVDIRWEKDSKDKSSITEYTLHFKPDDGTWQTKKLSSTSDRYSLHGLKCGTRYHMYLTASNSLGTGEPSLSVNVRTKGAAPMPAPQQSFVSANATWAMLRLSGWQSAGCPIRHFKAQYRQRYQGQWKPVPDRIPSDRETYIVGPLLPDREYELMVTAHSEAGVTQADYKFRTIPLPLVVTTPIPVPVHREYEIPFHRNVNVVIPVVFSSLVLIIVLFTVAICFRRYSTTAQDRRIAQQGTDSDSQKAVTDSLLMSEISQQQKICGKQIPTTANGSHYSSPTRRQEQHVTNTPKGTEHRRTDKQHEYAEPYIAFPSSRQRSEEGGFATIKRAPPRSGSVTSAYKPGFS